MKTTYLIFLSFVFVGCFTRELNEEINSIYLLENQYTIGCYGSEIGTVYDVDGISYLVVDEAMLREKVRNEEDLTKLCTSNVTNMNSLFLNNNSFNQDISKWDTSNVTDTSFMFGASGNLEDYDNIDDFYSAMRENGSRFNQDISRWDVSNVINMREMFSFARTFNQEINRWDVSNVTSMRSMFFWK
jgi:surface protein